MNSNNEFNGFSKVREEFELDLAHYDNLNYHTNNYDQTEVD